MLRPSYPPEFERLWTVYPKKRDKGAALKAFVALRITAEDVDWLIPRVLAYAKMCSKEEREQKYIKSLGPWLNGSCFDDVIEMVDKHLQCHYKGCTKQGDHLDGWKRYCTEHKAVISNGPET